MVPWFPFARRTLASAAPRPGHDDWLKEATRIYDDVLMRWNVADATLLSRIDMAVDSALGNSVLSVCVIFPRSIVTMHSSATRMATKSRARPIVRQDMAYRHVALLHTAQRYTPNVRIISMKTQPDNLKNFLDDLKTAQSISGDVYVNASCIEQLRTAVDGTEGKEVVYYGEASKLEAYFNLKRNADNSLIPVN